MLLHASLLSSVMVDMRCRPRKRGVVSSRQYGKIITHRRADCGDLHREPAPGSVRLRGDS